MSRRSQTQLAVLGVLAVEPATGYGVRKAITETLGHFWSESFGRIYPTLAQLEEEGLVSHDAQGRYAITRPGRSQLRELLREPPETERPRNGLLLRLFFAAHFPKEDTQALLLKAQQEARSALAKYEAIEREIRAEEHPEAEHWLATVRFGIHHARATLAWATECLSERTEKRPAGKTGK